MTSSGKSSHRTAEVIFENDVLPTRMWASIIRAAFFQFFALFAFSSVRNLLLLKPFSVEGEGFPIGWLRSNFYAIVHPSSWFFDILTVGCFAALGLIYARNFQTTSKVTQGSGAGSLRVILISALAASTSNGILDALTSLAGHVILSACLLGCYVGLLGPNRFASLTMLYDLEYGTERCLNQPHLFLVVSGAYTGLRLWWRFHGPSNGNLLRFPLVQLSGNSLLRQRISGLIKDSSIDVALGLRWYYVLYLLLGHRLENFVAEFLHVDLNTYYENGGGVFTSSPGISHTMWHHLSLFFHC